MRLAVLGLAAGWLLTACNVTRRLHDGEYLLQQVAIETETGDLPRRERITAADLKAYLRQKPNKKFLGTNLYLWLYNLADPEKKNRWNNFKRRLGEEPVLFDAALTERSADNFKNYMDSRGFFASEVTYEVDTVRPRRARVTYRTRQGTPYRITSYGYDFRDATLGPIVLADTVRSLIRPGEVFDIATLEAERERIVDNLRSRGYYNFSVGNIDYLADTLAGDRTVGLKMIVRRHLTGYDERGEALMEDNTVYRIGQINFFPSYDPTVFRNDSLYRLTLDTVRYRGVNVVYNGRPNLRARVAREMIPLYENLTYNANRISRTYDKLMSTGYFKSARIVFTEEPRRIEVVDTVTRPALHGDTTYVRRRTEGILRCDILCTPALKQSFTVELEGSVTSSFYGLSASAGYQNRNLFRGAEALDVDFTIGTEYMRAPEARKRTAVEFGVSASLSFPRFLFPVHTRRFQTLVLPRTKVAVSVNFQDRPYYRRSLSNASWGYAWDYRGYSSFLLRPVDITVVDVSYLDDDFFASLQNRYLQNSYKSQLIPALSFSYVYNNQRRDLGGNATVLRLNAEVAGNLVDGLEHLFSKPAPGTSYYTLFGIRYSQYFRVDASVSRKIMLGETTALAGRLFAGCGLAYGNAAVLPMDRLFYAGGSNSMRGWTPRTLGPGTVPIPADMLYPTQLGDMRLEANLEFRFPIWGIFHGATFLDAGNVWFMRRNDSEYAPEAVFRFDSFWKGLGFNTGVGLRLDIKFAVLRLDWGIQLHNPNNPSGERWIHNLRWKNTALNFGVGYPF